MKKQNHFVKLLGCVIMFILIFSGCSENFSDEKKIGRIRNRSL